MARWPGRTSSVVSRRGPPVSAASGRDCSLRPRGSRRASFGRAQGSPGRRTMSVRKSVGQPEAKGKIHMRMRGWKFCALL